MKLWVVGDARTTCQHFSWIQALWPIGGVASRLHTCSTAPRAAMGWGRGFLWSLLRPLPHPPGARKGPSSGVEVSKYRNNRLVWETLRCAFLVKDGCLQTPCGAPLWALFNFSEPGGGAPSAFPPLIVSRWCGQHTLESSGHLLQTRHRGLPLWRKAGQVVQAEACRPVLGGSSVSPTMHITTE